MKQLIVIAAGAASLLLAPGAASADENYFGYSYGAETLPKGQSEAYLWLTDRRGKDAGHYDAQDYKIELEHGLTDRMQVSGYVNFASHHIRGLEPDFNRVDRDFSFQGLQASAKYRVLSPYKDGIGLAFYAEPGWSRIHKVEGKRTTEFELELKAIVWWQEVLVHRNLSAAGPRRSSFCGPRFAPRRAREARTETQDRI